jgi:S-adenosylmethionine decarboxylase proenzyme
LNALGTHLIVELKECDSELLNSLAYVRRSMLEAAEVVGATVIDDTFHQFAPLGVTGVVAIAESHLTIHTWPEYGYAAVDIFTCGDTIAPREAVRFLIEKLNAQDSTITELQRGVLSELPTTTHS